MITKLVTKKQLDKWKKLYDENIAALRPNKVTGEVLVEYFKGKYHPLYPAPDEFHKVVILNAKDRGSACPQAETFMFENVMVGIDKASAFFHVESEDTEKAAKIWDDLFTYAGLDENDLRNYVITGQYLELIEKK